MPCLWLKSGHAQMAYSKMATLVWPANMCLREGLYVELFLIAAEHSTKFGISDDLQSLDYRMCRFIAISQEIYFRKICFPSK